MCGLGLELGGCSWGPGGFLPPAPFWLEGLGVSRWLLPWGSGRGAEVVRGCSDCSPCTLRSLLPC